MNVVTSRDLLRFPSKYMVPNTEFVVTKRNIKTYVVTIKPYEAPNVVTTPKVSDTPKPEDGTPTPEQPPSICSFIGCLEPVHKNCMCLEHCERYPKVDTP